MALTFLHLLPRLLDEVYLRAGHSGGGYEAAVFRADQSQIALSSIGTVFGGFQFSLESANPGHALLGHAFLFLQLPLVDAHFLVRFVQGLLQQRDILRVLFNLDHHFLDITFLLAEDFHGFGVSAFLLVQFELKVANL